MINYQCASFTATALVQFINDIMKLFLIIFRECKISYVLVTNEFAHDLQFDLFIVRIVTAQDAVVSFKAKEPKTVNRTIIKDTIG